MGSDKYMDILGCSSPEEVAVKVRQWSSDLSERDHLIRSTILDIHANVEEALKRILYRVLRKSLPLIGSEEEQESAKNVLYKMVDRLSFSMIHRLLAPLLEPFPNDFEVIPKLNEARNQAVHRGDLTDVHYKGRNPFSDLDSLAQLFFEAFTLRRALGKFEEWMIDDEAQISIWAKFYQEHQSGTT